MRGQCAKGSAAKAAIQSPTDETRLGQRPRSTPRASASSTCSAISPLGSAFTDHFLTDFRLGRVDPVGPGASARFRLRDSGVWLDTVIEEVERPHLIREHGYGGRSNRVPAFTVWELAEGPASSGCEVSVTFWTEPANPIDRARELLAPSRAFRRDWQRALGAAQGAGGGRPAGAQSRRRGRRPRSPRSTSSPAIRSHMLPPAMRRRPVAILISLLASLALAGALAACGEEEEPTEVVEGEPIEVADLEYNIGLTRFLNPDDNEDAEYLVGQPDGGARDHLPRGLPDDRERDRGPAAVGAQLRRQGHARERVRGGREREPVRARDRRPRFPAEGELPLPNTTAATGPEPGLAADLPGRRRRQREPAAEARRRDLRRRPARSSSTSRRLSLRRLQLALIAVVAGAVVVMAGLFSTEVRLGCLGVVVAGALATEPERRRPGAAGGCCSPPARRSRSPASRSRSSPSPPRPRPGSSRSPAPPWSSSAPRSAFPSSGPAGADG